MRSRFSVGAFVCILTLAVASSEADVPTVYVWTPQYTGSAPAGAPSAKEVQDDLSGILNFSKNYKAVESDVTPVSGTILRTIIAAPATSKDSYQVAFTVADAATLQRISGQTLNFLSADKPYYFQASQILALFSPHPMVAHANVVLIDDSPTDTQTSATAFNGPSFTEARLKEELAAYGIIALPIASFLGSTALAGTTAQGNPLVVTDADTAFNTACTMDPNIYGVRYVIQYAESRNPLFGFLNGHAQLNVHVQNCTTTYANAKALATTGDAHFLGNTGLLNPQYFALFNWALTRGRLNPSYRGFLGTGGIVASSLLPNVPDTSAQSTAVGKAAANISCAIALIIANPGKSINFSLSATRQSTPSFGSGAPSAVCSNVASASPLPSPSASPSPGAVLSPMLRLLSDPIPTPAPPHS